MKTPYKPPVKNVSIFLRLVGHLGSSPNIVVSSQKNWYTGKPVSLGGCDWFMQPH